MTYKKDKDIDYLEEKFPKGDKRRGEALVLIALARQEGKPFIQHDKDVDILDIWFKEKTDFCLEFFNVNLVMDFNKKGDILGLEFFDFGEHIKEAVEYNEKIFNIKEYLKEMELNFKNQEYEFDKDFSVKLIFDKSF